MVNMSTQYQCSLFCSFYKGGKFIKGYIEDVLKQSIFKHIEFVFLDCNSPDNEKEQILPLLDTYPNIKYYKLDSDPGLYAAWNIAVDLCSAELIGNWNIDDRKNDCGTEILVNQFYKYPKLYISYGLTYISNIANEKYTDNNFDQIYPCLPHSLSNLLNNNSPHCMPLWRKDIHTRFGPFNETYQTASDSDMWLRSAVGGAIIKMVNHPVGLYFYNPLGRSSNPETLKQMVSEVNSMRQKYTCYLH